MIEMNEEKKTVSQQIAELLKSNAEELPECYIGIEWIEAVEQISLLREPAVLQIPWCVTDLMLDEHGVTVLESEYNRLGGLKAQREDGTIDEKWLPRAERRSRFDILAILAWIPMKREDPEIQLEDVSKLICADNVREISRMVFKFWGIDLEAVEERIAQVEADAEESERKEEAEDTGDFPE